MQVKHGQFCLKPRFEAEAQRKLEMAQINQRSIFEAKFISHQIFWPTGRLCFGFVALFLLLCAG